MLVFGYVYLVASIYHKNQPNVGKYTIQGWYGYQSLVPYAPMGPFCKWFWSEFWMPKDILKGDLEH